MFQTQLATTPSYSPITALAHRKGDKVDVLLKAAADELRMAGFQLTGMVQNSRPGQSECCSEFFLEDLATGAAFEITQRLGRESQGCRLDYGILAQAHAAMEQGLRAGSDVLILNRFGYSESQGGGLRPLIELALEKGIPVLTSVNDTYLDAWYAYCGDFGAVIPGDRASLHCWIHSQMAARAARAATGNRYERAHHVS